MNKSYEDKLMERLVRLTEWEAEGILKAYIEGEEILGNDGFVTKKYLVLLERAER